MCYIMFSDLWESKDMLKLNIPMILTHSFQDSYSFHTHKPVAPHRNIILFRIWTCRGTQKNNTRIPGSL